MDALSGLMPDAMYRAADFLVASKRSLGSWGSVMACKSTTQKNVSAEEGLSSETVFTCIIWSCQTASFRLCHIESYHSQHLPFIRDKTSLTVLRTLQVSLIAVILLFSWSPTWLAMPVAGAQHICSRAWAARTIELLHLHPVPNGA